jgi:hypothetical protein
VQAVQHQLGRGGRAQAHRALGLLRFEPGGAGVDQQARDAVRAGPARTAEKLVEIGVAGVRDPGLGAVHHPPRAVARRPGLQGRGVRAALRFGEGVRAEQLAAEQLGQHLALLLGPVRDDRVAGQSVHADRLGDRQPAPGQDLQDLKIDLVRLARPAVGLGIGQPEQARPAQRPDGLAREHA